MAPQIDDLLGQEFSLLKKLLVFVFLKRNLSVLLLQQLEVLFVEVLHRGLVFLDDFLQVQLVPLFLLQFFPQVLVLFLESLKTFVVLGQLLVQVPFALLDGFGVVIVLSELEEAKKSLLLLLLLGHSSFLEILLQRLVRLMDDYSYVIHHFVLREAQQRLALGVGDFLEPITTEYETLEVSAGRPEQTNFSNSQKGTNLVEHQLGGEFGEQLLPSISLVGLLALAQSQHQLFGFFKLKHVINY